MKQKLITIILTLTVILAPILIVPDCINQSHYILKLWVLLIAGLLLMALLLTNYKNFSIDEKDVFILVFLGLVIISAIFAVDIKTAIIGEEDRYEGLLMFITYICIYLCSKKFFKYEKIENFLNIMFYVSMIIGLLGIAQTYINYPKLYPIFNKEISAICSTFGNANFFGSFISIVLPVSMVIFIFKENKKSFILSLVMFFNMIASGNRSTWVAFAIVAIIGIIYVAKNRKEEYFKRMAILVICFCLIFIYLLYATGTNSTTFDKFNLMREDLKKASKEGLTSELGSQRIAIWQLVFKLINKKPILGCGVDCLRLGLYKYCFEDSVEFYNNIGIFPDKAHNEYLQIAATIGIPALAIYLILVSTILLPKMKYMLKNKANLILCITIISYLVQAFFNISTIGVAPIFWMILGLADNKEVQEKINNFL